MTLRIFEAPDEAAESIQQAQVSLAPRLLFCFWASLVAAIPTVTTVFAAWQVTGLFRSMTDAENARAERILGYLHIFNLPLIIALCIAAVLAFALAIVLFTKERYRPAAVGLPFSIGVPLLAVTPAIFLWRVESMTIDLLSGRLRGPVVSTAQTISTLLFTAWGSAFLVQGVILICAVVSLCIPVRLRSDPSSFNRPFIWSVVGVLFLFFAFAYFVLV